MAKSLFVDPTVVVDEDDMRLLKMEADPMDVLMVEPYE